MDISQGWLSASYKKEDQLRKNISLLKIFVGILLAIILILSAGWMTAPSRLTVYIPPDIQNGATMKAGTIPAPLIYSFTYEIWQELNYWPSDGTLDYIKNIHTYWSYLTPKFQAELLAEFDELKRLGQTQRVRYMQGLSGAAYDVQNIKQLSSDTWVIYLKMRLSEYKNKQLVKDVEILYPIKVTRTNVSPRNNPYGLVISGFAEEPTRVMTYV